MTNLSEFFQLISEQKKDVIEEPSIINSILNNAILESPFSKIKPVPENSIESNISETYIKEYKIPENKIIEDTISILDEIKKDEVKPEIIKESQDLKTLKFKIDSIEKWLQNIPLTGGEGGGAGDAISITNPVKTVYSDYIITRRDYYIGVNSEQVTNITLPINVNSGRIIKIKDESGHASLTPINIIGNVDNDPNGVELRIDNGALTFIYNNGWKII